MAKRKTRAKRKTAKVIEEKGKVLPLQKQVSFIERAKQFLYEVKIEFKKITWPTRKETTGTTIAVISFSLFVAAYLGLIDILLSKLVQWLVY